MRLRAEVNAALDDMGIGRTPSEGNFILAHFGEDPKTGAAAADAFLKSQGIIIRRMEGYGLAGHLRITVGNEAECKALIAALRAFRGAA